MAAPYESGSSAKSNTALRHPDRHNYPSLRKSGTIAARFSVYHLQSRCQVVHWGALLARLWKRISRTPLPPLGIQNQQLTTN
jgi:hypothetical protein